MEDFTVSRTTKYRGGGGSGPGLLFLRLAAEGTECNLRGIEELVGTPVLKCVNENPVGDAGNEIANTLMTGKRGHGFAVRSVGRLARIIVIFAFRQFCIIGTFPGFQATSNGCVLEGWS